VSWQLRKHSGSGFNGEISKSNDIYNGLKAIIDASVEEKQISAIAHKLKNNENLLDILLKKYLKDKNYDDLKARLENFYKKTMEDTGDNKYTSLTRELLLKFMCIADEKTEIEIFEETFAYFADQGVFHYISITNIELLEEKVLPNISEITKILSKGADALEGAKALMVGLIAITFSVNMWLVLFLLGMVNLFAHAICNLFTSVLPLAMRDKINSGFLSGLLNGCGYIGATISTYGLGYLQTIGTDWVNIFIILTACALVPVIVSVIMVIHGKIKKQKQIF
jgi:ABC-type multidrug transport system fused ATPase/permease subunit